jgi:hypothetical protein
LSMTSSSSTVQHHADPLGGDGLRAVRVVIGDRDQGDVGERVECGRVLRGDCSASGDATLIGWPIAALVQ